MERNAAMAMFVIVPRDKCAAESACFDHVREVSWKLRLILRGFEERLDVRVVIRDVWARMAFCNAEIGQQKGDWLRFHRAAAIGMDREGPRVYTLLPDRLS